MFNTLLKFGVPFDATLDRFWIEPSKSYKRTKEHAAILKAKLRLDEKKSVEFAALQATVHLANTSFFSQPIDISDELLKEVILEKITKFHQYLPRNDNKAKHRFLLFAEEAYHTEFQNYLMDGNKRLNSVWLTQDLNAFSIKQSKRIFPHLKVGDPIDFNDLVSDVLPMHLVPSFTKIINYVMAFSNDIPNTSVYCNVLLQCFDCLHNRIDIDDALKAAWLVSYNSVILEEVFGLVLSNFRELLTEQKEEYPFLNYAFLDFYFKYLDEKTDDGISRYDHHLVFETFKQHVLPKSVDLTPYQAFNSVANYINRSQFNLRKVALDDIHHGFEAFQSISMSGVEKPSVLIQPLLSNDIPIESLLDLKEKLNQLIYQPVSSLTSAFSQRDSLFVTQLSDIEEKAKDFAQDPLANIDSLNLLSSEKKSLLEAQIAAASDYLDNVKVLRDAFNEIVSKHNQRHAPKSDDQAKHLLSEVETFRGLLHDAEVEIESLTQTKRDLTEQLKKQSQITVPKAPRCDLTFDDLVEFLDSKNPCQAIVQLIIAKRGWVKVSDTLLKSLNDISLFSRPAELARYLLKLTSEPFIADVQGRGSVGGFEYFSKSTLAFKESETTMKSDELRRQREFFFKGKKMLCEGHLKIGINNTEQHQLRIHFSINDGCLYLGYIGRHLAIA